MRQKDTYMDNFDVTVTTVQYDDNHINKWSTILGALVT